MANLTLRQKEVLLLICKHIDEKGYAPSMRELGKLAGLASTNAVDDHLQALQDRGYIERVPKVARGLRVIKRLEEDRASQTQEAEESKSGVFDVQAPQGQPRKE